MYWYCKEKFSLGHLWEWKGWHSLSSGGNCSNTVATLLNVEYCCTCSYFSWGVFPEWKFHLVSSRCKKVKFLTKNVFSFLFCSRHPHLMWWNLQQGSSLILWTMVPCLTMVCFIPVASESGELLKFVCCLFIFLNQCLNVLGISFTVYTQLETLNCHFNMNFNIWTSKLQYQDMIQSKSKQQQQS